MSLDFLDLKHYLPLTRFLLLSRYEERQKELEAIANPIMSRLYGAGAPGAEGGAPPASHDDGPSVEEVD